MKAHASFFFASLTLAVIAPLPARADGDPVVDIIRLIVAISSEKNSRRDCDDDRRHEKHRQNHVIVVPRYNRIARCDEGTGYYERKGDYWYPTAEIYGRRPTWYVKKERQREHGIKFTTQEYAPRIHTDRRYVEDRRSRDHYDPRWD